MALALRNWPGNNDRMALNPKIDSPPFAATVAAPLQHYQVDPVH